MSTDFEHGGNVFAVARSLGVAPEELCDFSASINPLGMAPAVREAVMGSFDRLLHYPDSEAAELRGALAAFHGVADQNICVTNGSTELIYLAPRLVEGKRGLVVAPPFAEYAKALALAGWSVDYHELRPADGFALDPERLREQLEGGYDILFLGNPGNPTGRLVSRAEVGELLDICRSAGTFLVLDEAFMDFCEEGSAKELMCRNDRAVIFRSLTKFYALPGLRLGCAIGSPKVIGRLQALRGPWSVNGVAQVAGLASLADGEYRARTLAFIAGEREWLLAGLGRIAGLKPYPSAANYLLVEIVQGPVAGELCRLLLAERILLRNCANFAGLDDRFFRVAVRNREENGRLLAALAAALAT
ncbi:threonine-phosphate decarboxylase CobD [Geobacter sp. AOG1]|uniref:threonine-phosphate decarboxylase CobD n=1 Tax=Geobacter sp. AOG1 TaxID=1566346 RepID=UPI001CC386EB|nr:threonine-phosphate decarboxylase CobD [Geobacter sp. AOG1]GFE56499.1 threonine-phosphate decarboxylase [Geobacter sp. AOG1]